MQYNLSMINKYFKIKSFRCYQIILFAIIFVYSSFSTMYSQESAPKEEVKAPISTEAPENNVKEETKILVLTETPIGSRVNNVGDIVYFLLPEQFVLDGYAIPKDSRLKGKIATKTYSKDRSVVDSLGLDFDTLILEDGTAIPITARLITKDNSGLIKRDTAKDSLVIDENFDEKGNSLLNLENTNKHIFLPSKSTLEVALAVDKNKLAGINSDQKENLSINKIDIDSYSVMQDLMNSVLTRLIENKSLNLKKEELLGKLNQTYKSKNNKNYNALESCTIKLFPFISSTNIYRMDLLLSVFSSNKIITVDEQDPEKANKVELFYNGRSQEIKTFILKGSREVESNKPVGTIENIVFFVVQENPKNIDRTANNKFKRMSIEQDQLLAVLLFQRVEKNIVWSYFEEFPGFEGKQTTGALPLLIVKNIILNPEITNSYDYFFIDKTLLNNEYLKSSINKLNFNKNSEGYHYLPLKLPHDVMNEVKYKYSKMNLE